MIIKINNVPIIEVLNKITKQDYPYRKGIYAFESMASTGKTRIYKLLTKAMSSDKSVLAYTYDDVARVRNQNKVLANEIGITEDTRIVIFDRAGLYYEDLISSIPKLREQVMVFIDCKYGSLGEEVHSCEIELVSPSKCIIYTL